MEFFKNLSLKTKLLSSIVISLTLVCVLTLKVLYLYWSDAQSLSHSNSLRKLAISANGLVHELQKERGATAIYLGSRGDRFSSELKQQRLITNEKKQVFEQQLTDIREIYIDQDTENLLVDIASKITKLNGLRSQVDAVSVETATALNYYTSNNTLLLNINSRLTLDITDPLLAKTSAAFQYLLQAKERAGIERAMISAAFSSNSASAELKQKIISKGVEQSTFMAMFNKMAPAKVLEKIDKILDNPVIAQVEKMRKIAWQQDMNFGVDAKEWFDKSTARINLLKQTEDTLTKSLSQAMIAQENESSFLFKQLFAISSILLVITAAISWFSIRIVTQQAQHLHKAMRKFGQEADLNAHATVLSQDELGQLATAFNQMVEQMQSLISQMQNTNQSLDKTSTNLDQVSYSVKQQVDQGLFQTEQAATSMAEMDSSVSEVAESCAHAADQSKQANEDADSGSKLLAEVRSEMHDLSQVLSSTNNVVQQLAADSEEIGSILDVIRGVAEQTNLLALNAAIEAARAGEQGRGFAVVADEVRSLASKTQESTVLIQDNIEKLQSGGQNAVKAISSSLERADKTDNSLNHAIDNLQSITSKIDDVNQKNLQVATATSQQSSSVNEINQNVQTIQQRYQDTEKSVNQLHEVSTEINQLSDALSKSISRFKL